MKIKLTLAEISSLFDELNGQIIDTKTGERGKGVLAHKLSIRAKYILNNELNKPLLDIVKSYEESRIELFKELGVEQDGQYVVAPENQQQLFDKIMELNAIEKSIDVPKLNAGEFYNIETENYFPILLDKVLTKEIEETPVIAL